MKQFLWAGGERMMLVARPRLCVFIEGEAFIPAENGPNAPKLEKMLLCVFQVLAGQPERNSQILRKSVLLI